jgi:hypothetical protein
VQLSPAPGTGLQSPETDSQNRRYRDLIRRQRPHVPHLNPRKRPQIAGYSSETGKHRFASDCVVVDAARIEPVSTSNSLLYRVYATTRKSSGEMIRKLSVIRSRKRSHFLGTVRLRKRRIADLNWAKVS